LEHHGSLRRTDARHRQIRIDELLPKQITLIHGPGCPVCVTSLEIIDKALEIAARPNVIFTSFGDMLVFLADNGFTKRESQRRRRAHCLFAAGCRKTFRTNPAKEIVFFWRWL